MLPPIGTKIKFLTDLYDSDDVELMAKAGDIGRVSDHYDSYILAKISAVEFVAYSDEYEVLL
jgi:hypothetical protein